MSYYASGGDYANYGNGRIPDDKLYHMIERASDDLDVMTYSRIIVTEFNNLAYFQRDRVIKAVCKHADFLYQYGDFLDVPFTNYGAGSIKMSFGKDQTVSVGGVKTSNAVYNLLKATGLIDRRLG
jgi:hypothetical protein